LFLQVHRETDRFFAASGVQLAETQRGMFHFHRVVFSQHLKNKVDLALTKTSDLRINLNLDGVPIASKSHTHPSHSQTSRLLTSSLSLVGIPIDSGMVLSIRIDKLRVFINKTLSTQSLINQLLIKRVVLLISVDSR
jgi:hypothetical protein